MPDTLDLGRLEKLLAGVALPWSYRPYEHDDWGFIRSPEKHSYLIGPYMPVVAIARDSDVTGADMDAHRAAKTDPYEPHGQLIVAAVNALPHLLSRISELESALRRISEGDIPRPVGKAWRTDGQASKHDKCIHDRWMYEDCDNCTAEFARNVLGDKA